MEEKNNIGSLFDRIAGTYDRFNHILSLNADKSWRRRSVASLKASGTVLDVAVGTGDLAMEILRQHKADNVTGIDLSEEMMLVGRRKAERKGYDGRISFQKASALEMPFPPESFDIVTCAYGVRNFSDPDKGLREMFRVLKRGGQLMILEFSYPENPLIRSIYDFFFTNLMPVVGRLVSKDKSAYVYFRESVKNFFWGEEMAGHIRSAGFSDVSFRTFSFGITTVYLARKNE